MVLPSGVIELDNAAAESNDRAKVTLAATRSRYAQGLLFLYVFAWPAVILLAPVFWIYHPLAGVLFALVVGLHVNTQLGLFYHELWHQSFFKTQSYNRFFFWLISFYLCTSPQFYGIAHATHHKDIHTYDDLEFWPANKRTTVARARIGLIFELCFGIIAWTFRVAPAIWKHKNYSRRVSILFPCGWLLMFAALMFASHLLYGPLYWYAAVAYWLHLLLFAVSLRMLQYSEHLGITAPDLDYKTRVKLTRNTRREGLLNRLWHKLTLNETTEHTLHHMRAGVPYRRYLPLPPPPPSNPVRPVSAASLPRIIWEYWKDPLREINAESPDLDEIPQLGAEGSQ